MKLYLYTMLIVLPILAVAAGLGWCAGSLVGEWVHGNSVLLGGMGSSLFILLSSIPAAMLSDKLEKKMR